MATRRPPGRMAAGHVLVVVVVALTIGALFNAGDLRATAARQPLSWQRSLALAVAEPLYAASRALWLDRPRRAIDQALGRPRTPTAAFAAEAPSAPPAVVATSPSVPTSPPEASPTSIPSPTRRQISAAAPLRLYIGGDSMVGQFGPAMANLAADTGVVRAQFQYEFESGLTRPDFIDWPARLREVAARFDPDVMVLLVGGNDAQPMKLNGVVYEPEAPQWQAEYRRRVAALMAELVADGRSVYWVGMPIARDAEFRSRMRILNRIYRTEADAHDGVTFVDSWQLFAGPDGHYSEYLPNESGKVVDMRLNDGIHLTTAGAYRLARVVLARVAQDWSLPAA